MVTSGCLPPNLVRLSVHHDVDASRAFFVLVAVVAKYTRTTRLHRGRNAAHSWQGLKPRLERSL
jgi:hypothetical protein